jgi:hypothetical protein
VAICFSTVLACDFEGDSFAAFSALLSPAANSPLKYWKIASVLRVFRFGLASAATFCALVALLMFSSMSPSVSPFSATLKKVLATSDAVVGFASSPAAYN